VAEPAYVRHLERAGLIMDPPRVKGMVVWSDAGLRVVRHLVEHFRTLVAARREPAVVEHGFLADPAEYHAVFGGYANVYAVAPAAARFAGRLLRADNLVTTMAGLRADGTDGPRLAVGGLLRRFDGRTPPLFRDRYIWPAVQLTERVVPAAALELLEYYRTATERLFASVGLATVTVRTTALDDYGKVTYLVVTALPNGRPTVLATLYVLADRLRHALGEARDVVDVGFTGKVLATCAMLHADRHGLALPSTLAPVQLAVTTGPDTDPARTGTLLASLRAAGVRTAARTAARATSIRNRAEPGWQALGTPLVLGLDREKPGDVALALRQPLARRRLAAPPAPDTVREWLREHDRRLLSRSADLLDRTLSTGAHLRALCTRCASTADAFGTLIPEERASCATCGAPDAPRTFISTEGRFY
jgi:hypothetical protein